MADDGQIRIGLSIDTSGLAGAKSQAQDSADQIADAYKRVASAALETQNVQNRHADILKQYQKGNIDAAVSAKLLADNLQENAVATNNLANAKRTLTAIVNEEGAAVRGNAVAQEEETQAIIHGISARQTAATSIGILEGRMMSGNRAAGAFLATTLGLGPALQAAFPVIGALALGAVLVEIVKGVANFSEKASELATELNTDWLTGAIGQMTGLAKATEEADKQIEKFAKNNDEARQKIATAAVEHARLSAELATPGAKGAQAGSIAADNVRAQQIQQRIDALEQEKELATQAAKGYGANASSQQFADEHGSVGIAEQRKLQEQSIAEYKSAELAQTSLIAEKENLILQAEVTRAKVPRPQNDRLPDEIAKAAIEAAHAADAILAPEERIRAELQKQLELHLQAEQAANRLASVEAARAAKAGEPNELTHGTQAERDALRNQEDLAATGKADADIYQLRIDDLTNYLDTQNKLEVEAYRKEIENQKAVAEEWKKNHEQQMKQLQDATNLQLKAATDQENAAKRQIEFQEKLGILKPKEGAQEQIGAINTQESQQVGALQAQQAQINPTYSEANATKYEEIQNQITEIQRRASEERAQIVQQETLKEVAAWQQGYQQMSNAVISATNTWLTTHKSFGNAFIDAGKHLTVEFIDDLLKMGSQYVEHEAMKFAVHEGWIAATKAADTSAAAASASVKAAQSAAQVAANVTVAQSDAGVAAATAAAMAAVGGPIAAAAAGAAMLAIMQPFVLAASLDTGGIVPGARGAGVPILAHGGEEVVPGPITAMVADAQRNGGSFGGGGHTFRSSSTINATVLDSKGLEGFARRAADVNGMQMQRYARRLNSTM